MPRVLAVPTVVLASIVISLGSGSAGGQPLPAHTGTRLLQSGSLVVEVGDPASDQCPWNKGLRFSPVANVLRAQLHGQEFLYSPLGGGALSYLGGLPMEFDIGQEAFQPDPPGYNEGANGDLFLKIGVGILRRNSAAYDFSTSYPIVELAHTTATWQQDRVHFVQTLNGTANGYACHLEENLIIKNDRIVMEYLLRNTGTKTFTTEQYLHNFTTFSSRSVGPNVRLSFPYDFTSSPEVVPWQPPAKARTLAVAAQPTVIRIANMIEYTDRAPSVPKIWVYTPEGYAGAERFAVEHLDLHQRVTVEASIPAAYVGIWTTDYQVSPEQFLQVTLAPGQEARFTRTYTFRVDGFVPQDCTGDRTVDHNDLSAVSAAWLSEAGAVSWNPACDVSSPADDRIDLRDFTALAGRWREPEGLPAPVAHWRLDETAGTTLLDERGEHPGDLYNFPDDGSQWVSGVSKGALQFDGIDDYARIEPGPAVAGAGPRTITAWIKFSERPSDKQVILAWGELAPGKYWLLEADATRRLRFSCGTGFAYTTKTVGDTRWHHVAAALDPLVPGSPRVSDVKLYVDGEPQIVYEMAEQPTGTGVANALTLGASHVPDDTLFFHGIIDEVRVYDAVLSAAHIDHVYRETTPP